MKAQELSLPHVFWRRGFEVDVTLGARKTRDGKQTTLVYLNKEHGGSAERLVVEKHAGGRHG